MGLSLEEKLASLFQPDTLLPAQFLDTFQRKSHLEPEKRLMMAVLEDAIACYQKYAFARDPRGKAMFRDAEEWIEETGAGWLFSFENVCDVLGLNADYLRRGLRRLVETKQAGPSRSRVYRLASRRERKSAHGASAAGGQRLLKVVGR
jgi:hypothetical protein